MYKRATLKGIEMETEIKVVRGNPIACGFWRDARWHMGWSTFGEPGRYEVCWIENGRMYVKLVNRILPLNVPLDTVMNPMARLIPAKT